MGRGVKKCNQASSYLCGDFRMLISPYKASHKNSNDYDNEMTMRSKMTNYSQSHHGTPLRLMCAPHCDQFNPSVQNGERGGAHINNTLQKVEIFTCKVVYCNGNILLFSLSYETSYLARYPFHIVTYLINYVFTSQVLDLHSFSITYKHKNLFQY